MENHVVFLHENLTKKTTDKYLLNLAHAFYHMGHKVTLMVCHGNPKELIEEFEFLDQIDVEFCASWIPRSLLGSFPHLMSTFKAIWLALRIAQKPPALILMDLPTIAIGLIKFLSRHRIFYYENFKNLGNREEICRHSFLMPTLHRAKFMKMADEVFVENSLFAEIYCRSFPALKKPLIFYKSIDTGLWRGAEVDIRRIIPDLDDDFKLIVSINKFRKSSNFKLVMDAFELLLATLGDSKKTRNYHLVIAGSCRSQQEDFQYNRVINWAKIRKCGSQMTILKTLPQIHEKSLIKNASVMIFTGKFDTQADLYLKSLSLGKMIVASNRGIASKIIKNRLTGVLVEPESRKIASEVQKLLQSPQVKLFMSGIAKDCFRQLYSFDSLCKQLKIVALPREKVGKVS